MRPIMAFALPVLLGCCALPGAARAQTGMVPAAGVAGVPGVAAPGAAGRDALSGQCGPAVQLRILRALDLGDIRLPPGSRGYVAVSPDGLPLNSPGVLVRRPPSPGEVEICGLPNQDIALGVGSTVLELQTPQGPSVARDVTTFDLRGDGITLRRIGQGRWEGRLGASGRGRIRIGATANITADGRHGTASSQLWIDVVPR
jgi:hypothetical protein